MLVAMTILREPEIFLIDAKRHKGLYLVVLAQRFEFASQRAGLSKLAEQSVRARLDQVASFVRREFHTMYRFLLDQSRTTVYRPVARTNEFA